MDLHSSHSTSNYHRSTYSTKSTSAKQLSTTSPTTYSTTTVTSSTKPCKPKPATTTPTKKQRKQLKYPKVLQININTLSNKINELALLAKQHGKDIITVQEKKIKPTTRTPTIAGFTIIRQDRTHKYGGGLLTYIKNNITFFTIQIPPNINQAATELRISQVHLSNNNIST
jgi:hypothetical protein